MHPLAEDTAAVLVRTAGACGRLTLNRPGAINALTTGMVATIYGALLVWANDPSVHFVVLDGVGERGLCAGGDVRALYREIKAGRPEVADAFFRQEYRLNFLIATYPKPFVALMDGVVMGGGIGISAHGSHRIVTERSTLAMPETAIGFVPDVGGTHLLGTMAGEFGTYLGLTGARVGAADAIACGLADMMVTSAELPRLMADLEASTGAAAMEDCLHSYRVRPSSDGSILKQAWIGECFAAETVEQIFAALAAHPDTEAQRVRQQMGKMSPTSLKITLQTLRNGRKRNNLASCLEQEYRIALIRTKEPDFTEGVRAALVDKDRTPKWQPATLEEVSPEDVSRYFTDEHAAKLDLQSP